MALDDWIRGLKNIGPLCIK